ncbi:MAG: hypothetical protein EOM18_15050, partial [Clostridia bacterium]|nr:hypothetical protein [Clostridia bacterium]
MNFWDRRGRSKCLLILVVFVLALGGSTCLTSADQDEEKSYNDEGYNKEEYIEEEIMGDMELREVERAVDALLEDDISFGEMMNNLKEGKQALDSNMLKEAFGKLLEEAVGIQKNTFIQIIFLVLLASILSNLSQVFQNQQIGEISFYMVYLLLFVMLLKTFESFAGQIEDTLNGIMTFMKALLPSYYLAMGVASGISTATVFYQMIMIIIFLSEKIILKILVPCVRIYLLMELINYLTREEFLSKLTELLKNGIIWVLKTIVGVMLGMQLVQRLISPAVDALKRTVIGKT